jgi:annexin A7/11
MSYYPPSNGYPQQAPAFGGATYDPYMGSAGYPYSQGGVSMPEPFSGGPSPSYPVTGFNSALPYPPQPSASMGYPGSQPYPGMTSQPPVVMPSYDSAASGAYPSYPPQPSYPPAFSASVPNYPPAMGHGAPNYAAAALYPSVPSSYPTAPSYPPAASPMHHGVAQSYTPVQSAYPTSAAVPGNVHLSQGHGTVRFNSMFNAEEDAKVLRKAMKGFGTDEKTIIDVLGHRSNSQRQQIRLIYKTMFGRDLVSDLSSELSFRFKQAVLAVMKAPAEYDAEELIKAIRGLGTDEETLVEILCSRTNQQIVEIKAAYRNLCRRELERDLVGDTSGHFRRLVVALSTGGRREDGYIDIEKARRDAMELYQAGERRWGTDESKFNQILCSQSHAQLRCVFEEYKRIASRSLEQSIRSEMSGDLQMGMLAIVSVVQNPRRYFAERMYRSMKGLGTNDDILIRVVVSRCEVDMYEIKQEFQHMYGQTVESFIEGDTSGDYRKMLQTLVRG